MDWIFSCQMDALYVAPMWQIEDYAHAAGLG
jgi:hypothetical protein